MSGTFGRSLRGIVTMTLSLLIVGGPATAVLADGGPDRVLPGGQTVSMYAARCGAEAYGVARAGFGDRIHERCPHQAPVAGASAPVTVTEVQTADGGTSLMWIWLVVGVTVVAAAGAWATTMRRRRPRPAV